MRIAAPQYVLDALEALRKTREVSMLSHPDVVFAAQIAGFDKAAAWLERLGPARYAVGAQRGFDLDRDPRRVTLKTTSSDEPNVSLRTIAYEVHIDGKYLTHFADKLDALDRIATLSALPEAELDAIAAAAAEGARA